MEEHKYNSFVSMLSKQTPEHKELSIKPINFDMFQATVVGKGEFDLTALSQLYCWAHEQLILRMQYIEFFKEYCPNSNEYWMKDVENVVDQDDDRPFYEVYIDMETFMESKHRLEQAKRIEQTGMFVPDNNELSATLLKLFCMKHPEMTDRIVNNSYRETACFRSYEPEPVKMIAEYIEEHYVKPALKERMDSMNITEVLFLDIDGKPMIDFKYKECK
jgi:hypothetical protein